MINLLMHQENNGVKRWAIGSYAIVALAPEKLLRIQQELSFTTHPISLQILSEALNKPVCLNFSIGNMFFINNIMLTRFFDKYRQRSLQSPINLTDKSIIERFKKSFSDEGEWYSLTNDAADFIVFSETILPLITLQEKHITKWLGGNLIDKIGGAYQDAKANADLLDIALEIMKRKQAMDNNGPTR